jgi:electron transfer flavoprotein alpha subunit
VSVLVVVEREAGGLDELSLQAVAFARSLEDGPVHAVAIGEGGENLAPLLGEHGVSTLHLAEGEVFDVFAPAAVARAVAELAERVSPDVVLAAGSDRGNDILARVGAFLDQPFAANCIGVTPGEPLRLTRQRWGGSLLEEAELHGRPSLLTVAPHAVGAQPVNGATAAVERFSLDLSETELALRVVEHVRAETAGVSLAEAKVVVSAGRGAGSAEGFGIIEELAGLLGGAVGCSRAVTMAGWRPHTDQVGQTGTKIAPDIYIACGISGATQHMAGCKGAKRILAVNTDPDASIMASADFAVIGDLHEVVPAVTAELRKAKGP